MPILVPHSFNSYQFSEQELAAASILTADQEALIQNDIAAVAEQILSEKYNPSRHQDFIQNDAFNKGQMAAFRFILLRSQETKEQLKNKNSSN